MFSRWRQENFFRYMRAHYGEVRPDAVRLDVERKRIMDAVRMATYNAESALARLVAPHYARAEDEARSLLHEIFQGLRRHGDRRHHPPRAHRPALCSPANPGARWSLCGAHRYQDLLPGDPAHSRLLGQGAVKAGTDSAAM